jgi:hypothetical protein
MSGFLKEDLYCLRRPETSISGVVMTCLYEREWQMLRQPLYDMK